MVLEYGILLIMLALICFECMNIKTVLVCSATEKNIIDFIQKLTDNASIVKSGNSFDKVLSLINDAVLYVGNDSGCFHTAVALGTKAICISGGSSFTRFLNYPQSKEYVVLIENNAKKFLTENLHAEDLKYKSWNLWGAVDAITIDDVKSAVTKLLTE